MSASKRDVLVQRAFKIFHENGFHATGMDKLVKLTGVSKTAMYRHFRTKEDLILAVLRLRDEQFRNWLTRRIEDLAQTPEQQLLALFDVLAEWFDREEFKGCMFIKASAEFQDDGHPLKAASAEHKRLLFTYFRNIAARTTARDPDLLARHLLMLKEGAVVTAHLQGVSGVAADARKAAKTLIEAALAAE
jgi:AcrR family transcriptional regulator